MAKCACKQIKMEKMYVLMFFLYLWSMDHHIESQVIEWPSYQLWTV